ALFRALWSDALPTWLQFESEATFLPISAGVRYFASLPKSLTPYKCSSAWARAARHEASSGRGHAAYFCSAASKYFCWSAVNSIFWHSWDANALNVSVKQTTQKNSFFTATLLGQLKYGLCQS